jgi:hypothetical protein
MIGSYNLIPLVQVIHLVVPNVLATLIIEEEVSSLGWGLDVRVHEIVWRVSVVQCLVLLLAPIHLEL